MKKIDSKIKKLIAEINEENKKLDSLIEKYKKNLDILRDLPEFSDPIVVVPQTCKRQLVVYLKSKLKGFSMKECLKAVLVSRYDGNLYNPLGLKTDDFRNFLTRDDTGLPDLCKEILKREQNQEGSKSKQSLINKLVDGYFKREEF